MTVPSITRSLTCLDLLSEKTDAKGKGKVNELELEIQENALGSSKQHAETRAISPDPMQSWCGVMPSWDEPEPPKAPQENTRVNKQKEKEVVNKQEGQRNAQ